MRAIFPMVSTVVSMKCVKRLGTPKDFWPMAVASFLSTVAVAGTCIGQLLIDPAVVGKHHT